MAATVERRNPRRYLAWCTECGDGYQGGKPTAQKWADRHNSERHSSEEV